MWRQLVAAYFNKSSFPDTCGLSRCIPKRYLKSGCVMNFCLITLINIVLLIDENHQKKSI